MKLQDMLFIIHARALLQQTSRCAASDLPNFLFIYFKYFILLFAKFVYITTLGHVLKKFKSAPPPLHTKVSWQD
jgi:hypothetical protein